jgi:hypothetical protein
MPSEQPRLPLETHESLLRHYHAPGFRLQAGEVAMYPRNRPRLSIPISAILIVAGIIIAKVML